MKLGMFSNIRIPRTWWHVNASHVRELNEHALVLRCQHPDVALSKFIISLYCYHKSDISQQGAAKLN